MVVAFSGGYVALSGAVSVLSIGADTDSTAANQFNTNGNGNDLLQQTDSGMNTPDPTGAINYQPNGTAPDAAQAGNDVTSQGEPTVDGAIDATAGSGPMTGAFVASADSAADGASVYAGGLLTIAANNYYGVQQTTGDGNIGLGAVGAAVSVTNIHNNTQAYAGSYATLQAVGTPVYHGSAGTQGPITIQANDQGGGIINAIAGAGGFFAAEANVATLNLTSNTSANVMNNAVILGPTIVYYLVPGVTIEATQTSTINVQGHGYQGGFAAAGAVAATANVTANTNAGVGDGAQIGTVGSKIENLEVETSANNFVTVSAQVGSAGVGAASYGKATGTVTLGGAAEIGAANVQSEDAVIVSATGQQSVTATSNELSPGLVAGVGGSDPTADVLGSFSAFVGAGAVINAASLSVTTQSTDTASADGEAFGTGIVTAIATDVEADVNVDTSAYLAAATLNLSGPATIAATATDTASANSGHLPQNLLQALFGSGGSSFGAITVGSITAHASIESMTKAYQDGADLTAGSTSVSAEATDQATSSTYSLVFGGLFAGQSNNSRATVSPEVDAYIQNALLQIAGSVSVSAEAETTVTASGASNSLGIVTAGTSHAVAMDIPTVNAYLGAGSNLNASGNFSVQGWHIPGAGTGAKATADDPSAGVVGIAGADPEATANAAVNSYVAAGGLLAAGGNIAITSNSSNYANAVASSVFDGLLGAGTSTPTTTVDGHTLAHMDGAITGGQTLTILSQSSNIGTANGTSGDVSIAGGFGVFTQTTVSPLTQASVGDNTDIASVKVSGNVSVTSQASDDATADGSGGAFGVLALGVVDTTATLTPQVNTFLGNNSSIISASGNVALSALHNYDQNGNLLAGKGSHASSSGAGGDKNVDAGIVSLNSLSPTATANAAVTNNVNPGATINAGGNVALLAQSDNSADSTAGILNFGVIGFGGVFAHAAAAGSTQAQMNGIDGLLAGGNLSVVAMGINATTANSTADGGGVVNFGASTASADDSPNVLSALGSTQLVNVGGDTTIQGLALGNSNADAEGGGGGVIQVGVSAGEASWKPAIEANVGAGTDLKSGGNVNILAYDNLNQAGTQDTSRQAYAKATASGGGLAAIEAASAQVNIASSTNAHIEPGANVAAGNNLIVNGLSYNQAGGNVNAAAGGIVNAGSADGELAMSSQTLAGTDDGAAAAPTTLSAGNLIQISSNTSDNGIGSIMGSGGGAIGGGGVDLNVHVDEPQSGPTTQARLGNNTTVFAPSAALQVLAQNQNNLSATVNQTVGGGVEGNVAQGDATAGSQNDPLQTLAEIGNNAKVTVGQFLLSADDANQQAAASCKTEADAGGADESATAEADEITDAKTHIARGSTITSATTLNVVAKADSVSTNSYSKTTVVAGFAVYDSQAGSNKFVTTEADLDAGSQLNAASVSVTASQPPRTGGTSTGTDYIFAPGYRRNADKTNISSNFDAGCSRNLTGSEVLTNTVNLNSNIDLTGSEDHNLTVDPTGMVTAENGLVVTDGTNPLGVGQTDGTGQIDVAALTPGNTSTLLVSAAGGTTTGSSSVVFQANGTVMIQNASPDNLFLGSLNVIEAGGSPPISNIANHANWTYSTTTAPGGGLVEVNDTNPTTGDIHLTGPITNPIGTTVIDNSGGSVFADNANAVIQTAAIDLAASQGTLGTLTQPLPMQLVFTPGITTGLFQANGANGVFLDVTPTSSNTGPLNLPVNNVSAFHGNVNLKFEDGQAAGSPTPDTITVQNVSAIQGSITITAGTSATIASNVVLTNQITSPLGTTTITTSAGNITSGGPDQLIRAHTVSLVANQGSIGAGTDIRIDLDPDQFNASALGNIDITGIGGPLIVGTVASTAGSVVLTAGAAPGGTADLVLNATSTISAPAGAVTLRAEDNVAIAAGSIIMAQGIVQVNGDFNNQNPAAGTNLQILGTIHAPVVALAGSTQMNDVFTLSRSDTTPTDIQLNAGNDVVNVQGLGAPATVFGGSGNATFNVGSLARAPGGVLSFLAALLTLDGGPATNVLNVDDTGSYANRVGTLTATTLTGLGMTGGITYSNMAAVNLFLGSGADALTIASTHAGATAVFAGAGPDTIDVQAISGPTTLWGGTGNLTTNVGSTQPTAGGVVDNISALLAVNGGAAVNALNVDDSGSIAAKSGTLTSSTLTGLGMADGITYTSMATLTIALGKGAENLTIASTDTGATSVQDGPGVDVVTVVATRGNTTVSGGAGNDTTNVQSTGAPATFNGGYGTAVINILSVGDVTTINADHAANTINIQSISGATTVYGDGRDVVNVGSKAPQLGGVVALIGAPLVVNGSGGMDIVNMDATGSSVPEVGVLAPTTLTGLGMAAGLTYGNLAALVIGLGSGSNNLTVAGTHTGSTLINGGSGGNAFDIQAVSGNTYVNGGAGSDAFTVGGASAATARTDKTLLAPLTMAGGAGTNSIAVTADVDFTLTNTSLQLSNGEAIGFTSIQRATLIGGPSDNQFDVSGWTGTGKLVGGGGLDTVVSAVDANAVLTNTSLTRSNGTSFVLSGFGAAIISGGAGNNTLDATGFSGTVWLYGGAGNDTLLAGSGNDYLDGGTGNDDLVGGAGQDVLIGMDGAGDTLIAGSGDTTIFGSLFADTIDGGPGDDLIYGDGGNDLIDGGAGNDTIVGGSGAATIYGGVGSDLIFDGGAGTIYADGKTTGNANDVDTIYGSGQDDIIAGQGNDIIYDQGGTDTISGGGSGTQVYVVPPGSVPLPTPSVPTPTDWPPSLVNSAPTLPTGADGLGRWGELAGSASDGGLSSSPGQAVESSVVAGASGQYIAWADSRDGQYAIYVAEHTASGWQQLAGSAQDGGISDSVGAARRPSIALNAAGEPVVAYTVFNGSVSDIDVAQFDPTANGGAGGWTALGSALGISGTGTADDAVITETAAGPVVAWLDTASGAANVFVKEFVGGVWTSLGAGAASGSGVSGSATSVRGLTLASDGTNVAVGWAQTVHALQQIYVLQYISGAWSQLAGSATGNGISNSSGRATAPSLAYFGGALFAVWQDDRSGVSQIDAAQFSGAAWTPVGSGTVSVSQGPATQPALAANGGQLYLAWIDNEFPGDPANADAVYAERWNGAAFASQVFGDAQDGGIADRLGVDQAAAAGR